MEDRERREMQLIWFGEWNRRHDQEEYSTTISRVDLHIFTWKFRAKFEHLVPYIKLRSGKLLTFM